MFRFLLHYQVVLALVCLDFLFRHTELAPQLWCNAMLCGIMLYKNGFISLMNKLCTKQAHSTDSNTKNSNVKYPQSGSWQNNTASEKRGNGVKDNAVFTLDFITI